MYSFYLKNQSKGKKFTADHFLAEKIPINTIYTIIQRAENDSGHQRVPGSGGIAKIMTKRNTQRLKTMFDHKNGILQTQAARKFKCIQVYISKTLKTKSLIRPKKKKNILLRTCDQIRSARTKCGRLYRISANKSLVLDDESYFIFNHSSISYLIFD